ncbi:MAG: HAMP domain-containing histidine kinase [Chloroflexi bacterium]|nr:HAMP domain-containing histidine kinase [Chloroflexota bacterium]
MAEAMKRQQSDLEQFLSVIAHELRAPLTVILGYTELLRRSKTPRPPAEERAVEQITSNARRLNAMIGELVDASRIQAQRVAIQPQTVNLGEQVGHLLATSLAPLLGDRPVQVDVAPDVPPVWADPTRVDQIVTNLLTNAARFSPPTTEITVDVGRADDQVRLSVTDRGPGIPPEALPHLFTRFYQVPEPGGGHHPGLGLGLYIVKGLAELQGGSVGVQSEVGRGSTFTVTLPVAPEAQRQAA